MDHEIGGSQTRTAETRGGEIEKGQDSSPAGELARRVYGVEDGALKKTKKWSSLKLDTNKSLWIWPNLADSRGCTSILHDGTRLGRCRTDTSRV